MKKRAFGKLYQELFYIPKHEKLPDKVFWCRMVLSLLTILACTAVMAASTFALFYSEVSTDHSTIAGAYYSVTVDNAENGTYICPLASEDKHVFEIKADGTATTGYCKIQVGENIYYTEQIFQGHSLILTVQAAKGTPIVFTPGWGALSEETCGNVIIHSATPFTVYTVEPTARLSNIAAHYSVSEEDILIYNNLLTATVDEESSTPLLPVGMELKIPSPAENAEPYKVPYATYVVEPTEPINEDTTVSGGDTTPTEQPTVETPAEDATSTEETPVTEQPTEEPAPVGDDTTTDAETTDTETTE